MKNIKRTAALLASVIMAVPFCGCSDEGESSTGKSIMYYDSNNSYVEPASVADPVKEKEMGSANKITGTVKGDVVALNGCDIKVKRVVSLGERKADEIHSEKAEMFAAEIEVTNHTGKTIEVSAMSGVTISVDGSKAVAGMDLTSELAAGKKIEGYKMLDYEAEDGQTVSGFTTFDAPIGWKEITVEYMPKTGENKFDSVSYKITPNDVE